LQHPGDTVTIVVGEVTLNEDAPFLNDDRYKMLYIEYRFLGVPLEETETPYSLPKPKPDKPISFNFTKGILHYSIL
jgi:protein fantom